MNTIRDMYYNNIRYDKDTYNLKELGKKFISSNRNNTDNLLDIYTFFTKTLIKVGKTRCTYYKTINNISASFHTGYQFLHGGYCCNIGETSKSITNNIALLYELYNDFDDLILGGFYYKNKTNMLKDILECSKDLYDYNNDMITNSKMTISNDGNNTRIIKDIDDIKLDIRFNRFSEKANIYILDNSDGNTASYSYTENYGLLTDEAKQFVTENLLIIYDDYIKYVEMINKLKIDIENTYKLHNLDKL